MIPIYLSAQARPDAHELAHRFNIPVTTARPRNGYFLTAQDDGISLHKAGDNTRIHIDFAGGAAHYRRTKGGGEMIAKAVNHTASPLIWDATGGLGRDSFVLAALGLKVRTFEQHPVVACLLADGLNRARNHPETQDIAQRIELVFGDAAATMPQLAAADGRPDVVYLDPMYPDRRKNAAVKKEMAYFHDIVGTAQDGSELLDTARHTAKKRIVVKRPRLGEFLDGQKPAYQYTGKSTRFDVYLPLHPEQEAV